MPVGGSDKDPFAYRWIKGKGRSTLANGELMKVRVRRYKKERRRGNCGGKILPLRPSGYEVLGGEAYLRRKDKARSII